MMIKPTRRGLLLGAGGLFCAPAIIKIDRLMKLAIAPAIVEITKPIDTLLTIDDIMRIALKSYHSSILFPDQYDSIFFEANANIHTVLRIRLPTR